MCHDTFAYFWRPLENPPTHKVQSTCKHLNAHSVALTKSKNSGASRALRAAHRGVLLLWPNQSARRHATYASFVTKYAHFMALCILGENVLGGDGLHRQAYWQKQTSETVRRNQNEKWKGGAARCRGSPWSALGITIKLYAKSITDCFVFKRCAQITLTVKSEANGTKR